MLSPACFGQQSNAKDVDLPAVGYKAEVRSAVSAPGAQLSAAEESSSVSLKLSSKPYTSVAPRIDQPGYASWLTWSLTADAPLKKTEERHDLLHLWTNNKVGDKII